MDKVFAVDATYPVTVEIRSGETGYRISIPAGVVTVERTSQWEPEPGACPFTDRSAEMPVNDKPSHADFVRAFRDEPHWPMWPTRGEEDLTGITIHHTLSHSPTATAKYCTASKGYPTTQYHYWVSADDGCPVWQLVDPALMIWHDHTGTRQKALSIGIAGRLHVGKPPEEQLAALVKLIKWLMEEYSIGQDEVQGHIDRAKRMSINTVCPGWDAADWREDFYQALGQM